jgi:hypothetical protein
MLGATQESNVWMLDGSECWSDGRGSESELGGAMRWPLREDVVSACWPFVVTRNTLDLGVDSVKKFIPA